MDIKVGRAAIAEATEKLKNWGRWGKDDQIGTLNHVRPEDIVQAASLIRRGKVFALGIPLDRGGPQTGLFGGRWNPIHTMLATGTDAVAGRQDVVPNIRYADDSINMPVQCATAPWASPARRAPRSRPIGERSRASSSSVIPMARSRSSRSSCVRREPIAPM